MDKKSLRNDIILIASLLLTALISLVVIFSTRTKDSLLAKIYVKDEVVEVIDLSKKEEKNYTVHGINGDLEVYTRDGSIRVVHSNCPHQDCVNMGFVNTTNKPIICAYNQVYIIIESQVEQEIVI